MSVIIIAAAAALCQEPDVAILEYVSRGMAKVPARIYRIDRELDELKEKVSKTKPLATIVGSKEQTQPKKNRQDIDRIRELTKEKTSLKSPTAFIPSIIQLTDDPGPNHQWGTIGILDQSRSYSVVLIVDKSNAVVESRYKGRSDPIRGEFYWLEMSTANFKLGSEVSITDTFKSVGQKDYPNPDGSINTIKIPWLRSIQADVNRAAAFLAKNGWNELPKTKPAKSPKQKQSGNSNSNAAGGKSSGGSG